MITVPSFSIDHTTLKAGLYLREVRKIGLSSIKIWDLRFVAPSEHRYISAPSMHSIEHIMAYKLRVLLGSKYIGFYTYGCHTGFAFCSLGSLKEEELKSALIEVIEHTVPIVSKDEIPSLTEKECGNPNCFNLKETSSWLQEYLTVLQQ